MPLFSSSLQKFFFQLEHISQIVRNQMKQNEMKRTAQQICTHTNTQALPFMEDIAYRIAK